MEAYRFETRISKDGKIQIPSFKNLIDKEVEVIILSKSELKEDTMTGAEFVAKWAGFMSDSNADFDEEKEKLEYLTKKYL